MVYTALVSQICGFVLDNEETYIHMQSCFREKLVQRPEPWTNDKQLFPFLSELSHSL